MKMGLGLLYKDRAERILVTLTKYVPSVAAVKTRLLYPRPFRAERQAFDLRLKPSDDSVEASDR